MREGNALDSVAGEALALLIPFGGVIGERLAGAIRREITRSMSSALKAAERSSGLSREDLEAWLNQDPRAVPLYLKVLWAAGMNGHDSTMRALGSVLGSAAKASLCGEPDAVEEAELALQALSQMGPKHFRVLAALGESQVTYSQDGSENLRQFTPAYIAERYGWAPHVASMCMINLAAAGLADTQPVLGPLAYVITELGIAVLQAASELPD